jgi:hypothetical protein
MRESNPIEPANYRRFLCHTVSIEIVDIEITMHSSAGIIIGTVAIPLGTIPIATIDQLLDITVL